MTADSRTGPLAWMRVVDLTDLRGALCGRILADLGADVISVVTPNPPGTDAERLAGQYRNANKKGVALDPFEPSGRAALDRLLADADVLIENVDPAGREDIDFEQIAADHPRLVRVALADFGLTGPRAAWRLEPLAALAASGSLHASGFPTMPPCNAPGHLAHDCASVYGAIGAIAAIADRDRHGAGQVVEVSVQEAALAGTNLWSICLADYVRVNPYLPSDGTRNADGSYWVLPASDGWIRTVIGSPRQWDGFVALLHDDDVLSGPEWKESSFRLMNSDAIRALASAGLSDRTRQELFDESMGSGATVGMMLWPSEFVAHPQVQSRSFFDTSGVGGTGSAPMATFPVQLSATPTALHRGQAGSSSAHTFSPRPEGAATTAPLRPGSYLLDGIRVVEFGAAAVVPEMSGVLSELGAEVIRVESSAHPDVLRFAGSSGKLNQAFAFNAENRGRKSVTIDMSTEVGRALAKRLCISADIVAENQRGGVMERLGLGYDDIRAEKPDIIYASSQGYGKGGPLGEMPAYGPLNSGFAGVHLLWNHADSPYPCGTSLNHPDHIAGKLLAVAVLAALAHRQRTGEGQHLDMAQTEAAAYLIGEVYLQAELSGTDPAPQGNDSTIAAPHGVYPCAGEDRWVAIVAQDDDAWERLVAAVGWEPDAHLAFLDARLEAKSAIDVRLGVWTAERSAVDVAETLQAAGVSAMPVMGPDDHHADPHLAEREFIVTLEHPEVGVERHVGNPLRMSRLPQRIAASSPCLGADTTEVLTSVLGLSANEIAQLTTDGILK